MTKYFAKITIGTALALAASQVASAATIVNIVPTNSGTLTAVDLVGATGAALNLASNSATYANNAAAAYIFAEGSFAGAQSFLLHFDDAQSGGGRRGGGQRRVSGSFGILLGAGETFGSFITAASDLDGSDPANGASYSSNGYRGIEGNDSLLTSIAGNLVTVSYDLRSSGQLDEARFMIQGAVAAVPEPATWMIMILGFATIGGAMRRHSPARVKRA